MGINYSKKNLLCCIKYGHLISKLKYIGVITGSSESESNQIAAKTSDDGELQK